MNYPLLINTIKQILRQKFPKESNKARLLSELLGISETSVYQKLSGKRQFSLEELLKIARLFSVSIDTLLGESSSGFSHQMELISTKDMAEEQRSNYIEETTRSLIEQVVKTDPSFYTAVCKNIPFISYCYFEWLLKFTRLKWRYLNNCLHDVSSLTEMRGYSDRMGKIREILVDSFPSFRKLTFIIDGNMVQNYLLDVCFFRKIGYLDPAEINFLLNDLDCLLKTAENICREGHTPTQGQEIEIFYSDIALYSDINLVESPIINQGMFFIQGFIPIIHKEPHTFQVLRECVNSCIRSSSSICGASIFDRNTFF
ncbi:MAG: helix-turn-helix domain-containing protein [Rikenellaceae bacterium]|nr:helix-turn-helix domain-containing protein [Rikenellaceae bacterium]